MTESTLACILKAERRLPMAEKVPVDVEIARLLGAHTAPELIGLLEREQHEVGLQIELAKLIVRGLGRAFCVEHRPEVIEKLSGLHLRRERIALTLKRLREGRAS